MRRKMTVQIFDLVVHLFPDVDDPQFAQFGFVGNQQGVQTFRAVPILRNSQDTDLLDQWAVGLKQDFERFGENVLSRTKDDHFLLTADDGNGRAGEMSDYAGARPPS